MNLDIDAQTSGSEPTQVIVWEEICFDGKCMELGCHGMELWFYV